MVEPGVVPEDPVWAELVSLIVFFWILFCFAEKIEVFPRNFSLPILAGIR